MGKNRTILITILLIIISLFLTACFKTNKNPIASFTASPTSGEAPLEVTFTATNSYDPDGTIISYEWDFGDGDTGTGETASHTYSTQGAYTATLTVTDDNGTSDQDAATITVEKLTGETLYVDDDLQDYPDADYTKIQDAVDAASNGYTIKVYPGTYNERVDVNKQVSLIGIDQPVIKYGTNWAIGLQEDGCTVDGFYVTGDGVGIKVYSSQNTITNNVANSNTWGISLDDHATQNHVISNTANSNGAAGIRIKEGSNLNTVKKNTIKYNEMYGISIWDSGENVLVENTASDNAYNALVLSNSNQNRIYLNNFLGPVSSNSSNIWKTSERKTYSYQGSSYTGFMGNYFNNYSGNDLNNDGIGDEAHVITGPAGEDDESDNYPLIAPIDNYTILD